ncbi:exo-alpha-sialidase, partial [bacterium]|nr:exo-alpha-sialidase [bacterium]
MSKRLRAEHGVVCAMPGEFYGYFGWPTVARLEDNTLVAVASGLRTAHVCPFGRTTLCVSRDDGRTWTSPRVINDSPLDDRDAGAVCLGGRRLLVTWFTTDNRTDCRWPNDAAARTRWEAGLANVTDANVSRFQGAWARVSEDGGESWLAPVRVPLTTPHGPIRLRTGEVFYFGKEFTSRDELEGGGIVAMKTIDAGRTWLRLGTVPLHPGTEYGNYH